jgi:hypothetical protein
VEALFVHTESGALRQGQGVRNTQLLVVRVLTHLVSSRRHSPEAGKTGKQRATEKKSFDRTAVIRQWVLYGALPSVRTDAA